jgi:hypothetical protein
MTHMQKFKSHKLSTLVLYLHRDGYLVAVYPEHPCAAKDGRVMLHRLVVENSLRRYLASDEFVHHRDGNKQNNDLNNLEVVTAAEHRQKHRIKPKKLTCPRCLNVFTAKIVAGGNKYSVATYCSAICSSAAKAEKISHKLKNKATTKKAAQSQNDTCLVCEKPLHKGATQFCSRACHNQAQRYVTRPTDEQLRVLVWALPTNRLAKQLGVSDNAIAKWCKLVGIEKPPRGYWTKNKVK